MYSLYDHRGEHVFLRSGKAKKVGCVIVVAIAAVTMLCTLPWKPMAAIVIHPKLNSDPVQDYVWRPNPKCDPTKPSYNNSLPFLANYIDFTPYKDGCGAVGDHVPLAHQAALENAEDEQQFGLWMAVGFILGIMVFASLMCVWCDRCHQHHYNDEEAVKLKHYDGSLALFGVGWIAVYALVLGSQAVNLYQTSEVWPSIWMCRPYQATWSAFGDLAELYVVNTSPDRGSVTITDPNEWNAIVGLAETCPGIGTRVTDDGNRSFKIDFEPSPLVKQAIDDAVSATWRGILWLVIAWPAYSAIIMLLLATEEQHKILKGWLSGCWCCYVPTAPFRSNAQVVVSDPAARVAAEGVPAAQPIVRRVISDTISVDSVEVARGQAARGDVKMPEGDLHLDVPQ
jgi:hypothetical protein